LKHIYSFSEGSAAQNDLLGGKGANLAEMTSLGLPVPPGFTITTNTCLEYFDNERSFPPGLEAELEAAIVKLEEQTDKKFGDSANPLLVSVRSGAKISMPGMMDTVLNLGLNDQTAEAMALKTEDPRFVYDSYRRFVQMFGDVVLGVEYEHFEEVIKKQKAKKNVTNDTDLHAEDWQKVIEDFKAIIEAKTREPFPDKPREQLKAAISAVFNSWQIPRAIKYREIHNIPHDLGTAVNIQTMVFGNLGNTSGTGVCFSRSPVSGKKKLYGDFLINAQGEDVVAGIRTPKEISELQEVMPEIYTELEETAAKLEKHFHDMQDIEFTIENSKFYLLQTRVGKRTARAAVRIAVDLVTEGLLTKKEALMRVEPKSLDRLLHPSLDPNMVKDVLAKGVPASPGAACGIAVFTAADAVKHHEGGQKVILVRHETSPEDIDGMHVAEGILTACGGKASHAAVVARGMGTPCVAGVTEMVVNPKAKKFTIGETVVHEGETITLDGTTGEVIVGTCKTIEPKLSKEFNQLLSWADQIRELKIRTNADTPTDALKAREFGAEGIGLCRTEHMFFDEERIDIMREVILAETKEERVKALDKLLPHQQEDFEAIFTAMDGLPVTIRLLDPPLHEFLPQRNRDIEKFANNFNLTFEQAKDRVKSLEEVNPMLGHRGSRLLITYPEILEMQIKAIIRASIAVENRGITVIPEIMVPLIGKLEEFIFLKKIITQTAQDLFTSEQASIDYTLGTMIELPRACTAADRIAKEADFFSFGTNDLTQMTFGFSRDDVARFLPAYQRLGILTEDPFEILDQKGVGTLIEMAVNLGRGTKKDLKISVCGEHGGDPASAKFFQAHGFNIISCSPYRVPIARLAAAQAVLLARKN
jgi:pyruvate,orthophosphate dikinase